MTAPLRWPDKAEAARTNSMSNARKIRAIVEGVIMTSKDLEMVRTMYQVSKLTHQIENDLGSVGARAEKEQRMT